MLISGFAGPLAQRFDKKNLAVTLFILSIVIGPVLLVLRLIDLNFGTTLLPPNGEQYGTLWWVMLVHSLIAASVAVLAWILVGSMTADVVEDSQKNRKYIDSNFESIRNTLITAETFYKSSFSSIADIPISCRFAILVARRVYRQIGYNILRKKNIENYNKSGKIYVSNLGKFFQTVLSFFDFLLLLISNVKIHYREAEHQMIKEEINLNERI